MMRRALALCLALLLGACATQAPSPDLGSRTDGMPAQQAGGTADAAGATGDIGPAASATLPRDAVLAIDFARNLGTFVHRHERAAERAIANLSAQGVATPEDALGWVTEQVDGRGAVQVTFIAGPAGDEAQWRAWARRVALPNAGVAQGAQIPADVAPDPAIGMRDLGDGSITDFERDKLRARRTALRIVTTDCALPARLVVVSWRRQGRDVFLAYRLAAETPAAAHGAVDGEVSVPWGGQHEFMLDARGRDLLAHRRSDADCSTLTASDDGLAGRTASRDTPSVFDVYTALRTGRTLWLDTSGNGMRWRIDGDRVRVLCSGTCAAQDQGAAP